MKKKLLIGLACVALSFGLTACGQPKTDELIRTAFTAETVKGFTPEEIVKGLSSTPANTAIRSDTIVSFSYNNNGLSLEGDAGLSLDLSLKNTPKDSGSDTYIDSSITVKLPEALSVITGFSEKTLPIQTYIRSNGDKVTAYFNQGKFDGREDVWTINESSMSELTSAVSKNVKTTQNITPEDNVQFIQNLLIERSKREKKPIEYSGKQVYSFNMTLPLGEPDVMEWVIKNATQVEPEGNISVDMEKVRTAIGQICQLSTINFTFYINVDDHKLAYTKLDYSNTDLNGVLRVIGANLPEGTMASLGDLNLQFKSAYFEKINYAQEDVVIPSDVAETPYDYDSYNEQYGKGELVSMIDPDPEPEPEPVKVRVYDWTYDWSNTSYPEEGTLGTYGNVDYKNMDLSTFREDGWDIAGNDEEFEFMPMYNDYYPDTYLYLYDENNSGKTEGIDRKVVGYDVDVSYASPDSIVPQFSWRGLTFGATPEEIIEAYGDDNVREESEDFTYLTYSYDIADIEFSFFNGEDFGTRHGLYEVIVKYNHVRLPEYEYVTPDTYIPN